MCQTRGTMPIQRILTGFLRFPWELFHVAGFPYSKRLPSGQPKKGSQLAGRGAIVVEVRLDVRARARVVHPLAVLTVEGAVVGGRRVLRRGFCAAVSTWPVDLSSFEQAPTVSTRSQECTPPMSFLKRGNPSSLASLWHCNPVACWFSVKNKEEGMNHSKGETTSWMAFLGGHSIPLRAIPCKPLAPIEQGFPSGSGSSLRASSPATWAPHPGVVVPEVLGLGFPVPRQSMGRTNQPAPHQMQKLMFKKKRGWLPVGTVPIVVTKPGHTMFSFNKNRLGTTKRRHGGVVPTVFAVILRETKWVARPSCLRNPFLVGNQMENHFSLFSCFSPDS